MEKKSYIQTVASISDGEQVIFFRHEYEGRPFSPPKLFQAVKIKVTYATTDKGKIRVDGGSIP